MLSTKDNAIGQRINSQGEQYWIPTVLILPEMPDLPGPHTITVDVDGSLYATS